MRFKSAIKSPDPIIRMLTSISHMAKECLIVLCPQNWKFHLNETFVQRSNPQCYASTPIAYVFSHYQIESLSANNEILLQCNIKSLLQAFKTAQAQINRAQQSICKLTKKNGTPTLSFEFWDDDGHELRVEIIQNVSVKPVQHSKLYLYEEPDLGNFDASTALPRLTSLKSVTERMLILQKQARGHSELHIDANDGRFLMQIKTEHCQLKTIWSNENFEKLSQNETSSCSARIDLRYLMKVIAALNGLECRDIKIAITRKLAVTVHARLNYRNDEEVDEEEMNDENSARITFYLCVYLDDEDESDEEEEEEEEGDDNDDHGSDGGDEDMD